MHNPTTSDAPAINAISALVRESLQPIFKETGDHGNVVPLVIWPTGENIHSLERFLANPVRPIATVYLSDYQSFIVYVNRHKLAGTHLFCELTTSGGKFEAHIDFHEGHEGKANWRQHTVVLTMQHSPEWLTWTAKNGKPMDQVSMANFLEENRLDIKVPDAATIIEVAQTFEATQGVNFKSALRQQSGDRALSYEVNTGAKAGEKGQLTIPERISLSLPIFVNGPEYDIDAFFRYDISGGVLKLRYELIRPHKFIELALAETRNAIAAQTELAVLSGCVAR